MCKMYVQAHGEGTCPDDLRNGNTISQFQWASAMLVT